MRVRPVLPSQWVISYFSRVAREWKPPSEWEGYQFSVKPPEDWRDPFYRVTLKVYYPTQKDWLAFTFMATEDFYRNAAMDATQCLHDMWTQNFERALTEKAA